MDADFFYLTLIFQFFNIIATKLQFTTFIASDLSESGACPRIINF